jgi:hypothetical protein
MSTESFPPQHFMTTVVEFPTERTPPTAYLCSGKPQEIPRCTDAACCVAPVTIATGMEFGTYTPTTTLGCRGGLHYNIVSYAVVGRNNQGAWHG